MARRYTVGQFFWYFGNFNVERAFTLSEVQEINELCAEFSLLDKRQYQPPKYLKGRRLRKGILVPMWPRTTIEKACKQFIKERNNK